MKQQPTHGYGIASTVLGILSVMPITGVWLGLLLAIFALVFGYMQLRRYSSGFGFIGLALGAIGVVLFFGQAIIFGL